MIPYIVTITANEDFYSVQIGFPSCFCTSRHADFFFGYMLFPGVFFSSLGIFLLLFILLHIQLVRNLHTCNKTRYIYIYIYSMLPWQPFDVVRSYIFVYRPVNL